LPASQEFANLTDTQGCKVHNALIAYNDSILDLRFWIESSER
jgi:hypothetical protein